VPHVTLRDIANNPDIDDIHAKWQETLEPLRGRLNQLLGQQWEEWQVPRELTDVDSTNLGQIAETPPTTTYIKDKKTLIHQEAEKLLADYWQARQDRQAEIDESIAKNSEQETLYDQPREVRHIVRVTGPFTVESLSPFKPISPDAAAILPQAEQEAHQQGNNGKYETTIMDNLREAGVQNTKAGERLEFELLEPLDGGLYLQAVGEYSDSNGLLKRVAVAIGPEHGTVGKDFIRDASNEATRQLRPQADMLLVCAFSFDGEVSEEAKRWGRLIVLPVRMNPDLTMASLLKKTDKANLFMVFGEPDMDVTNTEDGQIVVSLKGLDIYDPTTGEIRSSSTKDIACWFIDTNYNGNSFFVRHAYFTGADKPYEKLQKTLRAEINEPAWRMLYRTESVPFDKPETGKFAVKVINHYGDEVMKVWGNP
jgi:adenine-specific DNA-methyltransferase